MSSLWGSHKHTHFDNANQFMKRFLTQRDQANSNMPNTNRQHTLSWFNKLHAKHTHAHTHSSQLLWPIVKPPCHGALLSPRTIYPLLLLCWKAASEMVACTIESCCWLPLIGPSRSLRIHRLLPSQYCLDKDCIKCI